MELCQQHYQLRSISLALAVILFAVFGPTLIPYQVQGSEYQKGHFNHLIEKYANDLKPENYFAKPKIKVWDGVTVKLEKYRIRSVEIFKSSLLSGQVFEYAFLDQKNGNFCIRDSNGDGIFDQKKNSVITKLPLWTKDI